MSKFDRITERVRKWAERLPPDDREEFTDDMGEMVGDVVTVVREETKESIAAGMAAIEREGRQRVQNSAQPKRKRGDLRKLIEGHYFAAFAKGEIPPSDTEIARLLDCDPGHVHKVLKSHETRRLNGAKGDARAQQLARDGRARVKV